MAMGEHIKRRRLELNLSQQALADALGYKTRSSIAKLEKNCASISAEKLKSLANVLNTTVEYLVNGATPEESGHGTVISDSSLDKLPTSQKDKRKCIAVILAGGKNRVNQYSIPFQFISVKEKPVILYTMEAFQRHPLIDEIHVVCLEGWEDFLPAYADKYGITKLQEIIPAGDSGTKSVRNAVEWLSPKLSVFDILIFQEATRPFVDPETISNAIRCCKQYGTAITFERMDRMTPFLEAEHGGGLTHLPASRLINVQFPELYTVGILRQAFLEATNAHYPMNETICSVFLHHLGKELKFCEGNHNNLRIVYEADLKLMEALL